MFWVLGPGSISCKGFDCLWLRRAGTVSGQRALGMRSWHLLAQRPLDAPRPRRRSLPHQEAERGAPHSQDLAETLGWDAGLSWALSQGSGPEQEEPSSPAAGRSVRGSRLEREG